MTEETSPKSERRTDHLNKTAAAVAFTSCAGNEELRHRIRFIQSDEAPEMQRIHEIKQKEGQTWRLIGSEPVKRLTIGCPEADPDHVQHLIE